MSLWLKCFLIFICQAVFSFEGNSKTSFLKLQKNKEKYNLGLFVDFYEDKTQKLTLENILRPQYQKLFKKSKKEKPHFGYSQSAFWVRVKITNPEKVKGSWVLTVDYRILDFVNFYKNENGRWKKIETGDQKVFSKRELNYKDLSVTIPEITNTTTTYIRVKTNGPIEIPVKLQTSKSYSEKQIKEDYAMGIYFGLLISMVIYNFFIFISTKQKNYLYYVLFLFFTMLVILILRGYGFQYIFPNFPWMNNKGFSSIISLSVLSFIIFCKNYLNIDSKFQKFLNAFNSLTLLTMISFLSSLVLPYTISLRINMILIIASNILAFYVSFSRLKGGYKPAKFFLLAFGFFIVGVILRSLVAFDLAPSNDLTNNGVIFGVGFQAFLLALGLADLINSLLTEKIDAEKKLHDANKNLEEKVKLRTQDLSEALSNIKYLLNNMRQSVFTIDEEGTIMAPVSSYSKIIFENNIEGKNIYETVFNYYESSSQLLSTLQFNLACSFGSDDVQWDMIKENNPEKISFKSNDGLLKNLKISLTPLWNDDSLLEKIMFVIEDITEVEALEKVMKEKELESKKNVQILHELGLNKKEDLDIFFSNNFNLSKNLVRSAKSVRNLIDVQSDHKNEMSVLLRELHTIKGNARVFGLNLISEHAHFTESHLEKVYNPFEDINDINQSSIKEVIKNIYDLQSVFYSYLTPSKNIFKIDSFEETELLKSIHHNAINIDLHLSELFNCLSFEKKEDTYKIPQKVKHYDFLYDQIKRDFHTLYSSCLFINRKEISETVKKVEDDFNIFHKKNKSIDADDLKLNFLKSYKSLFIELISLYYESRKSKPNIIEANKLVELIRELYKATSLLTNNSPETKKDLMKIIYNMNLNENLNFINESFKIIFKQMGDETLSLKLKMDIWSYFLIILKIDLDKTTSEEEKSTLINKSGSTTDLDPSIFPNESLIKNIINGLGSDFKYFQEQVGSTFFSDQNYLFLNISPSSGDHISIKDVVEDIRHRRIKLLFEKVEDNSGLGDPFYKTIHKFIFKNFIKMPTYQKAINLLDSIISTGIDSERNLDEIKPDTIEILKENFEDLQNVISSLDLDIKSEGGSKLNVAMSNLNNVPLKYHIAKFSTAIKDIANDLGKNVSFKVSGIEGSIPKKSLYLLQDVLTHLFRNSIDHGIENTAERLHLSKNKNGTIGVHIEKNEEGDLFIKIADDGKGFNIRRIKNKAIENGLFKEDQLDKMSVEEISNLVFLPNFSTKENVSEISGRGIGMDVVKTSLEKINGSIKVISEEGKGTEFIIKLKSPKNNIKTNSVS